MKVKTATSLGILSGLFYGATALGYIPVDPKSQTEAYSLAWLIVVSTTLIPLFNHLFGKQFLKGWPNGFMNGLGSGLGLFLIIIGGAL